MEITPQRPSLARRAARTLVGAAALAGLVAAYAPSIAHAQTPDVTMPPALTDFSDCPALPAGVDPAAWRCEIHLATPRLRVGAVDVPALGPITMTHAEGLLPDGTRAQVWGAMHSAPTAVPGGLLGTPAGAHSPLLGLTVQPEYGGRSDFYTGQFSLRFRLRSPLLPQGCTIGASAPVDFRLKRSGPSEWVSRTPPLVRFSAYDDTFTAPAAEGCGPLAGLLNQRLGLPASSGNLMTYDASYTFRTYDQLPVR